ncbi:response regulator [Pseudodesulfovibrio sp. zrk46]|uniref:response regulator n=1 Tax=Pseudodesulfovibrio sp. zrk46 TaxID=2725288 RepID=UPI001449273B|nr:response regulator [Pseudodesulfovibrio sp. zrk46]QJB57184.1 response regulator [Pseudodesulfovibrio sp. zrk46]
MSDKTQIMFVDDEPNVLSALKRMLRSKHNEWDMTFVESGQKALEAMEHAEFDVVVSDIRMPGMDGADLLSRVKSLSPTTIRIALSGQVDLNEVIRSIKAVHQYISKPCESDELIEKIEGALHSRSVLTDQNLLELVTKLDALPVIPQVFHDIESELAQKEPSIDKIAEHISRDVGFVAKVLKLVNSPYFGLPSNVDSVHKAITMLGLDTIKALVLSTHMFSLYDEKKLPELSITLLWEHCFRVSTIAQLIAECEGLDRDTIAQCRMTGLLHDVGKLVLISSFPEQYKQMLNDINGTNKLIFEAEKETFGTSHAEVGAYLMGLWGLSGRLVYGIGHHHHKVNPDDQVSVIAHVADVFDHNCVIINEKYRKTKINEELEGLVDKAKRTKWIAYLKKKWDYWECIPAENIDIFMQSIGRGVK